MTDEIKITAEPQMDPNKCKFILEKPVIEGGSFRFENRESAKGSALPEKIFDLPNIAAVFIAANTVTVTKSSDVSWRDIGKDIGASIRQSIQSGSPLVSDAVKKNIPSEGEIREKALKILKEQINPSVASHGGSIELLDVKHNDVFVKMLGGCQGCAMSSATLKQGVEEAFRKAIPNLGSVYDTTDHAAGNNPFYQS